MTNRFTPTQVFTQFTGSTVTVFHNTLGEIIGRIIQVNNTGNINTDWIKMEYYKPNNTIATSFFSPQDLSAPQYYTGPLPPYQPWYQRRAAISRNFYKTQSDPDNGMYGLGSGQFNDINEMNNWINQMPRETSTNTEAEKYKQEALKAISKAKISVDDWKKYVKMKEQGGFPFYINYSIKQAEDAYKQAVAEFKNAKAKYDAAKGTR
jgi:hypothetical protein